MKLFLSGGGGTQDSKELDLKFLASIDTSKPVLYIPIAINATKHPYPSCLEWIQGVFQPLGFNNFTLWGEAELSTKTLEDFKQFSGVYIGGGNTFKLLKELREFGTLDILIKLVEQNIPIYGGSAGALIQAKSIITAEPHDTNDVNLTNLRALNFLHDSYLWVHYTSAEDEIIQKYITDYSLEKNIAIAEDGGLFISEKGIEVIGPASAFIFDGSGKREVRPGNLI
jgi:dipeptidase E